MSLIKIALKTDENEDISIDIKTECSLNEFEVATGYMMAALVAQSTTGMVVLESLLKDIKDGIRATDTEADTKVSRE